MTTYQHPAEMQSIGVQCDLLAAPPLKKFSKAQEESDHQATSDPVDTA